VELVYEQRSRRPLLLRVLLPRCLLALRTSPHPRAHHQRQHHHKFHLLYYNFARKSHFLPLEQESNCENCAWPTMSSHLLELPSELVAAIFAHLSREDLYEVNLTSKTCRALVAPLIWRHVDLVDCRAHTSPTTGHRTVTYGPGTATHSGRSIPAGASVGGDEHDDTPLIKKLWILAT
jgi:hypothetical protein